VYVQGGYTMTTIKSPDFTDKELEHISSFCRSGEKDSCFYCKEIMQKINFYFQQKAAMGSKTS
jgi:hypothetical protein